MDNDDIFQDDEIETAFPASEAVPGQAESRGAYRRFLEGAGECPWLEEYFQLRYEGWTWRRAAYIAWASTPAGKRWPDSQLELATMILGLKSDRTIRKWREKDPGIDERIGRLQVEALFQYRMDVINALIAVAKDADPKSHPDRRMYLEITGIYKPKGAMALMGPDGGPIKTSSSTDLSDVDDEDLDQIITNLSAAVE